MKLRSAMIFAKHMDRMIAFYESGMGFRLIPETRSDEWAELDAGGALLALHKIPDHIAKTIEITSPPYARRETPIKLIFEVDDVAATRAHLIAHGAVMFELSSWGGC